MATFFASEELAGGQNLSDILLSARSYLVEALRDLDDREFTWNLEIVNERAKQALMDEGYSEQEAQEIIVNGRGGEQVASPGDDPISGDEPSDNEPASDF
ncbi:MAG: hypothetical protein A3H51_01750 [Candidatus Spechtbacteria bacterium RIFCSPLOWO2_02_FULL_38_8]|uniref:Uncharacterized protein n=1 Tax=Candidatus Spechtbacteria bacterium RIFCSPLOWO2_02_FULL_38_8 TaxID=1802164 RepID=A0A1G2HHA3_9BACT|nr:MAG: hypothetical protein A3H51_01750 [Candidatus Spechtbacteria bacterium RIFCSPLOWO2_02_FULL_38_8]